MTTEYDLLLGDYIDQTSESIVSSTFENISSSNLLSVVQKDADYLVSSQPVKILLHDSLAAAFQSLESSNPEPTFETFKEVFPRALDLGLSRIFDTYGHTTSWYVISALGISFLNTFIQLNYTGPKSDYDSACLLPAPWAELFSISNPENANNTASTQDSSSSKRSFDILNNSTNRSKLDRWLLELFQVSGEHAYILTSNPLLLYLSLFLLVKSINDFSSSSEKHETVESWLNLDIISQLKAERGLLLPTMDWWELRAVKMLQDLLENSSGTISNYLISGFTNLNHSLISKIPTTDNISPLAARNIVASYHLEFGLCYQQYHMNLKAKSSIENAQSVSGLKWEITGAKGKRTKFQENAVSQLLLIAKSSEDSTNSTLEFNLQTPTKAPVSLELNDDTLLEQVEFSKEDVSNVPVKVTTLDVDPFNQPPLLKIDQCILLSLCQEIKNENPTHGLSKEQMLPFVSRVLENPNNWTIHTSALLQRSRLEKESTRTVQRSVLQIQALVDQTETSLESDAGFFERVSHFHLTSLPSVWDLKRELANALVSIGAIKSGLDIFENLYMWDEAVACYQLLEKTDTATQIVNKQLELNPTDPRLWCILGDIEQSPERWQKAWEVSGNRFSRAMRSLGSYYFKLGKFHECIDAFEKAMVLNPLFDKSWYTYGCAALQVEDWELAIKAFQAVVNIDYENGEAWNNLASVYLRMDNKKLEAWNCLNEALKSKYDSWQIWSNYLVTSVAIGRFASAIQALQRIVELRGDKDKAACVDVEILSIIINAVIRENSSAAHVTEERQRQRNSRLALLVEHLLVNVISQNITDSPEIWRLSSSFWMWKKDYPRCIECYERAYRCISIRPEVCYALPVFKDAVDRLVELVDIYKNLGPLPRPKDSQNPSGSALSMPNFKIKSKMAVQGLISKTKSHFESTPEFGKLESLLEEIKSW
ncbi:hypothetical protein BB560_002860 [Smittium megazygosporum]|uniref:Uncharacterized protein n=1 Tax=Smittium megazygosporum TaxID=133381 RepID=A0A2T9ZDJ8_9FUNG|nr:hypothetical protein BB560_002860 [Smittium megazygosporum]